MWRPAHGATTKPGLCRPGSGYGRELGRPGPRAGDRVALGRLTRALEPGWFEEQIDADADAPAPVTP
jgi:hypothetical protein